VSTTQIGGEPHSVFPDQSKLFYRLRCLSEWCFSRGSLERVPAPPRCTLALRGTVSGASRLWHAKNVALESPVRNALRPCLPNATPLRRGPIKAPVLIRIDLAVAHPGPTAQPVLSRCRRRPFPVLPAVALAGLIRAGREKSPLSLCGWRPRRKDWKMRL
jgi:hypothetical protein